MSTLQEDPLLARLDKHILQTLGFALIIVGFLLIIITLLGTSITNCPPSRCVPGGSSWMGVFVFFSGITLVIIGIILLIIASKHETKAGLAQRDRGSLIRFAIVSPC